jgi:hypothetical protein
VGAGDSVSTHATYKSITDNHYLNDGSKFIISDGTYDFDLDALTCDVTFTVEVSTGEEITTLMFLQAAASESNLFVCCEPQTGNAFWDHIGRALTPQVTLTATLGGQSQVYNGSFNLDPAWVVDNMEVWGWVNRTDGNGKVMQAGEFCEAHQVKVASPNGTVGSSPGTKEFPVDATYGGCLDDDVTVTLDKSGLPVGWDAELVVGASTFPTTASLGTMSLDDVEPYAVRVFSSGAPAVGTVTVTTEPVSGGRGTSVDYTVFHDSPAILFVDDDRGGTSETQILNAISNAGYAALTRTLTEVPIPESEELLGFNVVIWNTGELQTGTIATKGQNSLIDFLNGGGGLFLTSQGYLNHIGTGPEFTTDYLRVSSFTQDLQALTGTGVASDPIGDGLSFAFSPPFLDLGDVIVPNTGGEIWLEGSNGDIGVHYDSGTFRTVFLAAPFEGVPSGTDEVIMERVIDWLLAGQATGVTPMPQAPATRVSLAQNAPNPFSDSTTLRFSVPQSGPVKLSVYNVAGQRVVDLVNSTMDAGTYQTSWNGRDGSGVRVAGGVYFYRLQASGESLTKEMVRLK